MTVPKQFGPWTLTDDEQSRLCEYQRLRDLMTKDAENQDKLFKRDKEESRKEDPTAKCPPHMYVNMPKLVALTAADLILSQPPKITSKDPNVQPRIDALVKRSKLDSVAWKAVYWTAGLGDTFLIIVEREGEKAQEPVIALRRALGSVARNLRPQDSIKSRALMFKSKVGDVELYTEYASGKTRHYAYKKNDKGDLVEADLPEGYEAEIETGETRPLFVHLAALCGDDSDAGFGESDFLGTEDFIFEISNRWRQVSAILDKHAEPPMNVPDGSLDDQGAIDIRKNKVFERGIDGGGAEYVEWQSQLEQAYTEIDRLEKLIALLSQTPVALIGLDTSGQAESGRSLKFKLLTGLGKGRRSGMGLKEALEEAVALALRREDVLAKRPPGDYPVTAELPDTFIADEIETAEWIKNLKGANAISTRRAVAVGQRLTGQELEDEVAAIEAEGTPGIGFEAGRGLGQ